MSGGSNSGSGGNGTHRLREAAFNIRAGNSRAAEAILQEVSAVPPNRVVQLAFDAVDYITDESAAAEAQSNPQGDVANVGPFLLLVAARLLHGGICRDFSMYWSCRIDELRGVRQALQDFILRPSVKTQWLFPALNEVSVAWAVLSKLLLLAHGDAANPGAASEVPQSAVEFVRDEWLWMLNSAIEGSKQQQQQHQQNGPPSAAAAVGSLVSLSLLRQCVDESALMARASLGRGLPLDRHDSVRELIFKHVVPQFLCAAAEGLITVAETAKQMQQQNHSGAAFQLRLVAKLEEIFMSLVSWGPSAFHAEFAVDRIPATINWPPLFFRRCLFAKTTRQQQQQQHGGGGGGTINNNAAASELLLFDAAVAAFRLGITTTHINEVSLPALQILVQLCSVVMQPRYGAENEHPVPGQEPDFWTADESAQIFHEAYGVLMRFCGHQILNDFLPDPRRILDGNKNSGGTSSRNDVEPEEAIEYGGTMLRQVAFGCKRLTFNVLHRRILIHPNSIQCLPGGALGPLREFTTNAIRFAHDLSMVVRVSGGGGGGGNESQIEEPMTEAIAQLLNTWRDLVRTGLEDQECLSKISGSPLEQCLASCANSVFSCFVQSRVLFGQNLAEFAQQVRSSGARVRGDGGGGGLVSSCVVSRGMDYALEQINTVGLLGRNDARAACNLLSELLGSQTQALLSTTAGAAAAAAAATAHCGAGPPCAPSAAPQTESVWYLFKLVAVVLTDDECGSATDVPTEIVNLVASVERDALGAGAHNVEDPNFLRELEQQIPVFSLMRGTLHFCEQVQQQQGSVDAPPPIPPLVVCALLSLLRRFIWSYVDFDSSRSTEVRNHRVFASAFDGGAAIAAGAVSFLSWTLCRYSGDQEAIKEAADLLYALCSKEHIGPWFMEDRGRCRVACAAAAGDVSPQGGGPSRRLNGEQRGSLAGAIVSACATNAMKNTALDFLQYYVQGFCDPQAGDNFPAVADSVCSISNLLAQAKNANQLGTLVGTIQPYLVSVVGRVTDLNATPPQQQDYELLAALLDVFLNGIEVCSFNLPNDVIAFMLTSSVRVIEVIGVAIRYSCEHVLPRLQSNAEQRQVEEQRHLRMLKAAAALILCAAQWGNLYFPNFNLTLSGVNVTPELEQQNKAEEDERERMVGTLCTGGLILVLRESRATDLIEAHELNTVVFRVMKEIARQHTRYFLGVSEEHAGILLDATHWALQSADPELNEHGFSIIEAIAVTQDAARTMPNLLNKFLEACIDAIVSGSAFEERVQTALANAIFALGVCLGVDVLCGAFMNAVGQTPLLAQEGRGQDNKYVRAFREAMSSDIMQQQSRRNRRVFVPLLRRIVMTVRSASIFS